MEYIVSARKYRPMTFDSVVGQGSLTTTLKNAVRQGKLAHAYLFCGPRGVGKTTCARIFAKVINCTNLTPAGDACGECESCKAFNEGRSLNIFELDAASNNGVEHIKALMEQTHIPPQTGKYKVFIIDEVHMLSTQAFNAFLKTLEEPPAHVIFILATTEKHKILPTILSRCQIYDFERMSVANIVGHLKHVAEQEGITYEETALNVIAEKADGGMRDALSIFDQAASFCQGNLTYEKVLEDLNVLDAENYFNIIDLALQNKTADIMMIVNDILSRGFDGGHLINGLASHVRNVLMAIDPQTTQLIEASEKGRQRYAEQAKRCQPRFLYRALKALNRCDQGYRISSNKRLLVELTLIEVAQITQADEDDDGSGPRPCKRLKRLFEDLMASSRSSATNTQATPVSSSKSASAAAVAATAATITGQAGETTTAKAGGSNAAPLRLKNVGFSFRGVKEREQERLHANKDVSITNPDEDAAFTLEDAKREWLAIINIMKQDKALLTLSKRMKNVTLTMRTFPVIEGKVENHFLLNDMNSSRSKLQAELAERLKNGRLTLSFVLDETTKDENTLLSQEDFLEALSQEDTLFRNMQEELMLVIQN